MIQVTKGKYGKANIRQNALVENALEIGRAHV